MVDEGILLFSVNFGEMFCTAAPVSRALVIPLVIHGTICDQTSFGIISVLAKSRISTLNTQTNRRKFALSIVFGNVIAEIMQDSNLHSLD